MYIFGGNIKYIDSEGKVKDKSTRLVSSKDGFVNVDNDIRVSFSEEASGGAKLAYDDIEIVLIPNFVSKDITKAALSMEADSFGEECERVVYASAFADAKLVYTPTFEGFKEDIIVSRYNGVTEYSFRLLTNGAVLKDNLLYYEGKETARLGDIMIFDSDGQADIGSIKSETVKEGYEYLVTVCVNDEFMKNAVYPVYIDPSVVRIDTETINGTKTIQDAPVYYNNSNAAGGNAYNLCGYCGSSLGIGRVLYYLPGLIERADYQSITAAQINSVTLSLREASGKTGTAEVTSHPFCEDWQESVVTSGNVDFDNYDTSTTYSSIQTYSSSPNWWTFDLTQTAKAWRNGSFDSGVNGIILVNTNEGTSESAYYRTFLATEYSSSTYRPFITFNYTPVVSLNHTNIILPIGASFTINATTYPDGLSCSWSSLSSTIASITVNSTNDHIAYITANFAGLTRITVSINDANSICYVKVVDPIDTGYYFIQNIGNEGYIGPYNDSDSNGTSLYSYEIYSTTNNNNDWIQAYHLYQQSDGYCCLKSDENSKYITINGNNVVQENAHSSGTNQLWLVYETASGIYMIPKYDQDVSNQRRIAGDSLVNEDLFISTSVSVYSLWEFKEATAYGGAGTYNAVTYTSQTFLGKDETYRCCGYALNDENVWYGGNIPNITSHSDDMLDDVFTEIRAQIEEDLNRECRKVDETSLLKPNEYRIAMRIGYYSEEYKDVHYMKQLYDGTWAHKPGYLASEHKSASFNVGTGIWSTPINYNSMYQAIYPYSYQTPYYGFYNSNTIYFAVSISTYGG